MTYSSSH